MTASSHPYYNCMTRPHLGLIGPRALFARGSTHIQPTFLPETGTNSGRALRIGAPFSSHHRQALAPSIPGLAHPHCSSQLLSDRHPELRLPRPARASAVLDEAKTEHARHPQDGGLRAAPHPAGSPEGAERETATPGQRSGRLRCAQEGRLAIRAGRQPVALLEPAGEMGLVGEAASIGQGADRHMYEAAIG